LNSIGNRAHPFIAVVSRTIEHIRFLPYCGFSTFSVALVV
jgi:hypothetical protein